MNQMNQDHGLKLPANNEKIISSISMEIIIENFLREYPKIQSFDFSYNKLQFIENLLHLSKRNPNNLKPHGNNRIDFAM